MCSQCQQKSTEGSGNHTCRSCAGSGLYLCVFSPYNREESPLLSDFERSHAVLEFKMHVFSQLFIVNDEFYDRNAAIH